MTKSEKYHVAQLERAVEISRVDLDDLSPADFLKLKEELYQFIYGTNLGVAQQRMAVRVPWEKFNPKFLRRFKRDRDRKLIPDDCVREVVDFLRNCICAIAEKPGAISLGVKVTNAELSTTVQDPSSPFVLEWRIDPTEGIRLALLLHLAGSGLSADRIRHCPRDGCGNLFVLSSYARSDRERYCSIRCSRYAATLAYRARRVEKLEGKAARPPVKQRRTG